MELYTIDTDYIEHLRQFQLHIWANDKTTKLRPYVGVVLELGSYKYYAPLTSPKPKHKTMADKLHFIRLEHRGQLKAVVNLNNVNHPTPKGGGL